MKNQELQIALLEYLRSGDEKHIPKGLSKSRAKIYNRLTFNNIFNLITGGLPKFTGELGDKKMRSLVREFIGSKNMRTPYFYEMTSEFLQWYSSKRKNSIEFRYQCQLGHYEWVVNAIDILNDDNRSNWRQEIHMSSCYGWREDATVVRYDWPFHKPKSVVLHENSPVNLLLWRVDSPWTVRWRELSGEAASFYQFLIDNQSSVMKFSLDQYVKQVGISVQNSAAKNQIDTFVNEATYTISKAKHS